MKKILLIAASISCAVISCQQEEFTNPTEMNGTPAIRLVQMHQGKIVEVNATTRTNNAEDYLLQFDSQATYNSFLNQLKGMSHQDRMVLMDKYGLNSLQKVAAIADAELEKIGAEASNETDFREAYEEYKAKYEGVLINNVYDSSDLSLYVPEGDDLATYVVNENRQVVIGNEVETVNLSQSMSKSEQIVFGNNPTTLATNDKQTEQGWQVRFGSDNEKKVTTSVTLEKSSGVRVHAGYQKKMWYGWKRDNARETYFTFSVSNKYMYFTYPGVAGQIIRINNPLNLYVFYDKGIVDFYVGGLQPGIKSISGKFQLWTDFHAESTTQEYTNVFINDTRENKATLPKFDSKKAIGGDFALDYIWASN